MGNSFKGKCVWDVSDLCTKSSTAFCREQAERDSDSGEQLNEVAVSVGTVLPGALLLGEKISSEPPSTNRQCGDLRQTGIVVW